MTNFLQYALSLSSLGFHVFPCSPDDETTTEDRRKAPITGSGGCKLGTTDGEQIRAWWDRTPNANIGIHCKNLIVIDVDGEQNPYKTHHKDFASTGCLIAKTPRGGTHYFFAKPNGLTVRNSVKQFADNVDIRTDGGYVIASPSTIHGIPYTWVTEPFSGPEYLPEPPDFVIERLKQMAESHRVSATNVEYTIPTEASADRIMRYILSTDKSISGQNGSGTTFGVLGRLQWDFALSADQLWQWAQVYNAEKCEPPWTAKELKHKVEDVLGRWIPQDGRPRGAYLVSDQIQSPAIRNVVRLKPKNVDKTTFQEDLEAVGTQEIEADEQDDNPGIMPVEWFYEVPGLIKRIIQYSTDNAPHPNPWIAFAGALSLMSILTARVIRDQSGIRTNLYVLGLGLSASGKDFPRFVNSRILNEIGCGFLERNSFSSGEAVQDMLYKNPVRLCQTDEINNLLEQMSTAKGGPHGNTSSILLQLYSDSKSTYVMRSRAGDDEAKIIHQPHLTIFGTAIPKNYFSALSGSMLSNGLLSRMLVIEGGKRSPLNRKSSDSTPIPEVVIRTAKKWMDNHVKKENMPNPYAIRYSEEAECVVSGLVETVEKNCDEAFETGDDVKASVWGRVLESAKKLALLYTASTNLSDSWTEPNELVVGRPAIEWGAKVAIHQAKRTLWFAQNYQADSKIQADCQLVLEFLRVPKNNTTTRLKLSRKIRKLSSKEMEEVLSTLEDRGEITRNLNSSTGGRKAEIISIVKRRKQKNAKSDNS